MAAKVAHRTRPSPALLVAAVGLALAQPAAALSLGDIRIQSYLGETLEATVTVVASPDESIVPECFSAIPANIDGLPALSQVRFTLEPDATPPRLRIRTVGPQNEPALHLRLKASCPGSGGFSRDYTLLLDPPPVVVPPTVSPAPVSAPAAPGQPATASASPQTTSTTPGLRAMSGDTLASIAAAIYPRNRSARQAYVDALRNQNPAVAGLSPDQPIPEGTVVVLPDLREFSRTLGARSRDAAPATPPPATPRAEAKAAPAPARAPAPKADTPPRKAEPAAPKAEPPARAPEPPPGKAEAAPKPAAPKAEAAPKPAPPKAEPAPPKAEAPRPPAKTGERGDEFVLRLSSQDLDLSRSRAMDDKMRAQMRERLLLLDSDDQIAALLTMRNNLRQLESQVAQLQQRLVGAEGGGTPGTAGAGAGSAPTGTGAAPGGAATPGAAALPASAKPAPRPEPGFVESIPVWAWGLLSVIAAAVAAFVGSVVVLRRAGAARPAAPAAVGGAAMGGTLVRPAPTVGATATPSAGPSRIAERFPEIANGSISLDDPDTIVNAAKNFYEKGSLQRAIDLLQFAVSERPAEIKPWLALFELFHLESYSHEFGALAVRFREHHGNSESWPKVQEIGRDFDPGNPIYRP